MELMIRNVYLEFDIKTLDDVDISGTDYLPYEDPVFCTFRKRNVCVESRIYGNGGSIGVFVTGKGKKTGVSLDRADEKMERIARRLQHAGASTMHILRYIGVVRLYGKTAGMHADLFFFQVPITVGRFKRLTLERAMPWNPDLVQGEMIKMPPLETRMRYAVELCLAVMFTHAAGLVHKSIRPDNIHSTFYICSLVP